MKRISCGQLCIQFGSNWLLQWVKSERFLELKFRGVWELPKCFHFQDSSNSSLKNIGWSLTCRIRFYIAFFQRLEKHIERYLYNRKLPVRIWEWFLGMSESSLEIIRNISSKRNSLECIDNESPRSLLLGSNKILGSSVASNWKWITEYI